MENQDLVSQKFLNELPIYDSLSHPTIDGKWLSKNLNSSFSSLSIKMKNNNIIKANAVGISGLHDYSHEEFIRECNKYPNLVPIAGISLKNLNITNELKHIKSLGYKGIKVHPRFSGIKLTDPKLDLVFKESAKLHLPILLCTYFYEASLNMIENNYYTLVKLLNNNTKTKVILIHGGSVELLKYMELVRFHKNLLLDLSLTMMKYEGSSLDNDIKFLFKNFDRRICIGSDHPEYCYKDIRRRLVYFANGLRKEKVINIAYQNLMNFLEI